MTTKELKIGDVAPQFCLPNQENNEICLKDYHGKNVVIYFYPKDNTSGCTTEALDFTFYHENFEKNNTVILGISPDSVKSHKNFCQKKDLSITLLSDVGNEVVNLYGVWQKKKMYGKEYMGVVRSTFLVGTDGIIKALWRKVKVKGHAEEVLQAVSE